MRYSKDHKSETRHRIIETAAPLFRKFGFSGVSVDRLMNAAQLTRGGFYAHFKSKEALIVSILRRDVGLVRMMSDRLGKSRTSLNQQASDILADYLSKDNLEDIIAGCPLATMPIDASRASNSIRAAYSDRFKNLTEEPKRGLGSSPKDEADAIAVAVLAVGGVLLANASASAKEAEKIEQACLRKIEQLLNTG